MGIFGSRKTEVPPVAETGPAPAAPRAELPDSTNLSGTCTRCGYKSSFDLIHEQNITFSNLISVGRGGTPERDAVERVSLLYCRHCNEGLMVVENLWIGDARWDTASRGGTLAWRGFFWWPLAAAKVSTDVPETIRLAYAESVTCLAAGCPRAAATMARRTLEAICDEKGAMDGTLAVRLAALEKSGTLVPALAEWAKKVRLVGNKGAHFDPLQTVRAEDVTQLLSFLTELFKYLYEMPAELKRRRTETA